MIYLLPLLLTTTSLEAQPFSIAASSSLSLDLGSVYDDSQPDLQKQVTFDSQIPLHSLWGRQGSKRWGYGGALAVDLNDSDNQLRNGTVEFEYFVEDYLSLDLGFHLMDVVQQGEDAIAFNATVQLRWHFIHEDTWSMFMEGGGGLMRSSDNVPTNGSEFNFTILLGTGFSFDAGNNNRWLVGARWHHISNANTYSSNPSRDSIMFWAGISFPY